MVPAAGRQPPRERAPRLCANRWPTSTRARTAERILALPLLCNLHTRTSERRRTD